MPDSSEPRRPQTDKILTEQNRGAAERLVLGSSPVGSMIRIVLAVLLFVLLFGTVFFFARR